VTEPWFDNSYYHEEISEDEVVEPTGGSMTVLKSEMVGMWEQMNISQVTSWKILKKLVETLI